MYGSIKLNPDHVNLPLPRLCVIQGSAATVGFLDVPDAATSVVVSITNADGTALALQAAKVDGIWTVTIPATHFATPGLVTDAVSILAENEDAQWILGLGDLFIRAAQPTPTPGDPATNITDKTLEGETFDLDTADGENAAVRKLITKLGGSVALLLLSFTALAAPPSGYTNNTYTADGTTWTRHGALNVRSSYVVTDTQGGAGGITTNDVKNIVTNVVEVWGDDWRVIQGVACNVYESESGGLWEYYIEEMAQPWNTTYVYSATRLFRIDTTIPNSFHVILERNVVGRHNELGLAMVSDLPQNTPAPQLLLDGQNGTNYILKINASGGLDVFAIGE